MVPALREAGAKVSCMSARSNVQIMMQANRLARYIRENNITLIHCHLPWAGILGRLVRQLTGVPLLYTEHNKLERYHFLTRKMNVLTLGWNDRVLAVSGEVAASIRKFKGSQFPVQTIFNGVDTQKYSPEFCDKKIAKRNLGIPPQALVVGNVCVFRIQKRLMVWLDVAAKVKKQNPFVKFVLVGEGPVKEEVVNKIHALELGDYVLLPGLQEDVRPYLAAMDVFMSSSLFEGLPVALLEAMAMELPVVATAAGGIPEMVEDGNSGFVVPVNQPEQLLPIVIQLLEDGGLRERTGKAARSRIEERYSIQQMVRNLEEIYERVLEDKE
jgi:glycosyltransferase involved in cell wall biosynthesis